MTSWHLHPTYEQEKHPSKINTPFWIAAYFPRCFLSKRWYNKTWTLSVVNSVHLVQELQVSTSSVHYIQPSLISPVHRWFLGPNFPTARNSAGVMFSKRTSWRSSWWSHPIAYVDCPSLRIKDGNCQNINQEVSLFNMGGLFIMCHFQTMFVWLASIYRTQLFQFTSLVLYRTHFFSQSLWCTLRLLKPTPKMLKQTSTNVLPSSTVQDICTTPLAKRMTLWACKSMFATNGVWLNRLNQVLSWLASSNTVLLQVKLNEVVFSYTLLT